MNQEIQQYQSDDARITLDVRVENDIVWLTQAQIGILFGVQKSAISKHLKNIFNSGELCQESGGCVKSGAPSFFCKKALTLAG
ncbi:MAG: hypothetical protein IJK22_11130 [Bacteroidales bacterium]|nr:hypothetical protein [Bacteroidales bacterium]